MIFIWIPKTGGTTFSAMHPEMKVYTQWPDRTDLVYSDAMSFGHACPKQLLRHQIIPSTIWNDHEKIALVRNPYDRFLSLYHDYQRTGRISMDMTQKMFARAIIEMDPKPGFFNSYQFSMCAPQVEWLLPGVEIIKFEDFMATAPVKLNSGGYAYDLDPDAIAHVTDFYKADFVTLNYDTQ